MRVPGEMALKNLAADGDELFRRTHAAWPGRTRQWRDLEERRLAVMEHLKETEAAERVGEMAKLVAIFWQGIKFMTSYESMLMGLVTVLSIFLVSKRMLNVTYNVEFSIFAAGCVFPITFSIKSAFDRRERAVTALAVLKSNLMAVYSHFEMNPADEPPCLRVGRGAVGKTSPAEELRPLFLHLVHNVELCLRDDKKRQTTSTVFFEEGQQGRTAAAHVVYDLFVKIGNKIKEHTPEAFGYGDAEAAPDGMQRTWQFHHDAIVAFEEVRAIRFSSTPIGLRRFCYFLINFSCITLAPYWARYCDKELFAGNEAPSGVEDDLALGPDAAAWSRGWVTGAADGGYGCASAYLLGLLFSFIVFTLHRVQAELDDPFEGHRRDSIRWEPWKAQLLRPGQHGPHGPEIRGLRKRRTAGAEAPSR